jgi:FtsP/CotA-like multicopper oxidase with cupredoxin domain
MPTRRDVLLGAVAATLAGVARAQAPAPTVLRLQTRGIEVNGKAASVFGILQSDGTHGLVTEVGKPFRVRVENGIDAPSLIHWHGLTPPWQQDGVPGVSGPPIAPGGSADYDFPLTFGGTYWMHSHQGLQEQSLMTAPLIIRDPHAPHDQQEIVVLLSDFSFTSPEEIKPQLLAPSLKLPSQPLCPSFRITGPSAALADPARRAGRDRGMSGDFTAVGFRN